MSRRDIRTSMADVLRIFWHRIVGTRDRLVHGCDITDTDILRDTVTDGLPRLIAD